MKQAVLVTGANGLVGSKFTQQFADTYDFVSLDISNPLNPVDITQSASVLKALENTQAKHIVHYAAYTDVTGAWKQNGDESGIAYKVNVDGTKNIIAACEKTNKHLIHISTAYVFNGEKEGLYSESDELSPIEWYGHTKAEAERAVTESNIKWTILRIDQPFRSDTQVRPDVVRRVAQGLTDGTLYPQFTNHYFGPTYIDDFARVVDFIIKTDTIGLFNASSGEKWTDFDFAKLVNETLQLNGTVKPGDLDNYLRTLDRPYQRNTAMDVSKLKSILDFELLSVKEAVKTVVI
ncbi:MAG: NAD(P)-dependent oxidoreductase [Patescibacteria group bacterium]|nr:MAG: NAD(P)-dependent oxidoreductase [Patescibacteria group bacterium]